MDFTLRNRCVDGLAKISESKCANSAQKKRVVTMVTVAQAYN
ncbi:hypothetical protein [uncultured Maribacter sp.]